jgi:hypothetical protein
VYVGLLIKCALNIQLAQAVVLTTTVPTVIPTMVAVRTPVAFIGFASSASSLTPFSFW